MRNHHNNLSAMTMLSLTLFISFIALSGCDGKSNQTSNSDSAVSQNQADNADKKAELDSPITISHQLGTTIIDKRPQKVAVLSMNEADFLDQLQVPIAGMVKDFVPHFLSKYQNDNSIMDLGAIVQPNIERVYQLKPDLILMTPLQDNYYPELEQIAPTLHYDINYEDSHQSHVANVKKHLSILGRIFDKEALAEQKITDIDNDVKKVQQITANRPEKALVVLHNNGAFSNFGVQSRYGFIFNDFGVKPASTTVDTSLHGQPISSEFIENANPDILYIIDRTAVMEHRPTINADDVSNPLLRQTNAWKNGRVIFVDADAWYTTSASPTSLKLIIDDVIQGYQ